MGDHEKGINMETTETRTVRGAVSAQSMVNGRPRPNALVHLTDGRQSSRTGSNLLALCGANVRHNAVGHLLSYRPCRDCSVRASADGMRVVILEVTP